MKQVTKIAIVILTLVICIAILIVTILVDSRWDTLVIALISIIIVPFSTISWMWVTKDNKAKSVLRKMMENLKVLIKGTSAGRHLIKNSVRWVKLKNRVVRTNQTLEIKLDMIEICGDTYLKITRRHIYSLVSPNTNEVLGHKINIYTDLGFNLNELSEIDAESSLLEDLGFDVKCANAESRAKIRKGGFRSVSIPHNAEPLKSNLLLDYVKYDGAKACFEYKREGKDEHDITIDNPLTFVYETYGFYRPKDRLVWTVQDLSENFKVTIISDKPLTRFNLKVWVNHHERNNIRLNEDTVRNVYTLDFTSPVFPYQGFELYWDAHSISSKPQSKPNDLKKRNKNSSWSDP